MVKKEKTSKPLKVWWIWVLWLLLFFFTWSINGNEKVVVNWFYIALILSLMIYLFNVKKFGKKYWKKEGKNLWY